MEPLILKEPTPKVIFNGFADGYLDFELRVWTNYIDKKTEIRSSLNFIIEYYLRYQGIYPSFVQGIKYDGISSGKLQNSNDKSLQIPSLRVLLRKVAYFQNFSDIELRQLIENGYRKRLRADEILFRENDPGDAFYIILSGLVEVYVEKINKHLTKLSSGQFLGELALMLAIPRTATVRALEDTTLFVINHQGFEKLLKSHPDLAEEIVQELGKHQEELASRQQQLRQMGLVDASEDDTNLVSWVRKRVQKVFSL
jgi:potassium-dependent mechanosensitive channel